jgi:hypothetical protein
MEAEMTYDGEDKKSKSTSWLVRCSSEQKDFFQRLAAESGKNAGDFLHDAMENFVLKSTLQESPQLQKEMSEAEFLIERLSSLVRSKIYLLCEKERQMKEEQEKILQEREAKHHLFEEEKARLEDQYEHWQEKEKQRQDDEIQSLKEHFETEKRHWDKERLILQEDTQRQEEKIKQLSVDVSLYQKQLSDAMKLYENADLRNQELKRSLEQAETRNNELKKIADAYAQQEKQLEQLQHKMEIMQITYDQEKKFLIAEHELRLQLKQYATNMVKSPLLHSLQESQSTDEPG